MPETRSKIQIYNDQRGHYFLRPACLGVHTDAWQSRDPRPGAGTLSPAKPREIAKLRIIARAIGYSIWDYMELGMDEHRVVSTGGIK